LTLLRTRKSLNASASRDSQPFISSGKWLYCNRRPLAFLLTFFRSSGVKQDYTGGRSEETITSWIKKKTGPPSAPVTGEELAAKKSTLKRAVVYIGALEGDLYNAHIAAAKNPSLADTFEFLHTSDAVGADYGLTGTGIVVLRNFDEPVLAYAGDATAAGLADFVSSKATPRLINFDEDSIDPIFGKKADAIFLFSNEEGKGYQQVFE
jgi:protein disulfide-isomerase A1